jgi:hypothetical protein
MGPIKREKGKGKSERGTERLTVPLSLFPFPLSPY